MTRAPDRIRVRARPERLVARALHRQDFLLQLGLVLSDGLVVAAAATAAHRSPPGGGELEHLERPAVGRVEPAGGLGVELHDLVVFQLDAGCRGVKVAAQPLLAGDGREQQRSLEAISCRQPRPGAVLRVAFGEQLGRVVEADLGRWRGGMGGGRGGLVVVR